MRLQFGIYDQNDLLVEDWSAFVSKLLAVRGRHGFDSLKSTVMAHRFDVANILTNLTVYKAKLNYGATTVWEGRLEDIAANIFTGFDAAALGYWRAFLDAPYTALWSTQKYDNYVIITTDELASSANPKYRIDTRDRVWVGLVDGETYDTGAGLDVAAISFWAPHKGERKIKKITFNYDVDLPTNWRARVISYDEGFTSSNVEHTITTSGTGLATVTFGTDKDGFIFEVDNNSGAKATFTGETGSKYAKWSNVRVWTTDSANLYADEIVAALITFIGGINSNQLVDNSFLIQSPTVDLGEAIHEDTFPGDIIDQLAAIGDNSTPPVLYEAGVEAGGWVYFRPIGTVAQTWVVESGDIILTRSLEDMHNSAYGVYKDSNGRTLRTDVAVDQDSINQHGITRRLAVKLDTTTETVVVRRDLVLDNTAFPPPRANTLTLAAIYFEDGLEAPPWFLAPGDIVKIRNLPKIFTAVDDTLLTFTVDRVTYDPLKGRRGIIKIETKSLAPSVEVYLVQATKKRPAAATLADFFR